MFSFYSYPLEAQMFYLTKASCAMDGILYNIEGTTKKVYEFNTPVL